MTTGTALRDTQCGLRGFSTELLPFLLSIEGDRYEYEMKMLTQAAGTIPILQVPIQTIYLEDNASSHFHVLRDSFLIYKDLLAFALSSFGAFVLDYGAYALLAALFALGGSALGLFFANLAARVFSGTLNYHVNARWVFKDRPRERDSAWKYFGLALGIFSINSTLLLLLHHWRVANVYWIKLMVECILFFASFVVQKRFVFRNKRRENVMNQKNFMGGSPIVMQQFLLRF